MNKVSLEDIQQSLTPDIVRIMKIISFASMAFVSIFFAITVFMYLNAQPGKVSDRQISFISALTMVNGVLLFSCLVLSNIIQTILFSEKRFESMAGSMSVQNTSDIAVSYIGIVRTVKIIFMAVLEAPALFGLIVCLLSIFDGIIYEYPYYWINAAPYVVFMLLMAMDFPTKDKLVELFKNKLKFTLTY